MILDIQRFKLVKKPWIKFIFLLSFGTQTFDLCVFVRILMHTMSAERIQKTYAIRMYSLKVGFKPGVVRLYSDERLLAALSLAPYASTARLIKAIKKDYFSIFNVELLISDASLMVEIWGHLAAAYWARILQKKVKWSAVRSLTEWVIVRSDRIDCGIFHKDKNRWLWDVLAPFRNCIKGLIPFKRTSPH